MRKLIILVATFFCLHQAVAQVLTGKAAEAIIPQASEIKMDQRLKKPVFIGFKPGLVMPGNTALEILKNALGMRNFESWSQIRNESDEMGMQHIRYQQLYKGIKVEYGQYILHEKNGMVLSANGVFYETGDLSISPGIPADAALKLALNNINASKYIWENPGEEALLKSQQRNANVTWFPKAELVIFPANAVENVKTTALCWKFDVYSTEPLGRYYIYVNAVDGHIIFKENRICTIAVTGIGNTKYNGVKSFITDSIAANLFRLRDYTRSSGVETYNLLNGTAYNVAVDFTDSDNIWTSVVNQDDAALDAHFGAQSTYDYYKAVHGRDSYDNSGSALRSYVHYSTSYNNAFWDGSRMTYGDGNGSTFSPLTELDICGHELSHGVTAYTSGLVYSNESGALNESFSDIFGKTIDFFVNPLTANWKLGAKCYTPGTSGDALRYMDNPNLANDPDTYHGTYWYGGTLDNGGVHTNSGVPNFWYYLLVSGGTGTNDIGFNYNVTGIGIEKARRIAYRNNTFYLTSTATFADAGYYSLKSASDLFGNCSFEANQVKNAWDAVGVTGLQLNTNAAVAVSNAACLGGLIQLDAGGGTTFSWSGPNAFNSSLKNPSIASASANAAGIYTCIVTDASGCSGAATLNLLLNDPPVVNAGSDITICNGVSASLDAAGSIFGAGNNIGSSAPALPIPDFPAPAVYADMSINGALTASSIISVTIDSLTHTWDGDLDIRLVAPNGSEIVLSNGNGSSGHDYVNTKFAVGAATSIITGVAPFNGTFAPEQSFSKLTGTANGTWRLKIFDMGGQDVGTLWKWSIVLSANSISSYNWSPSSGLTNASINNPSALPPFNTAYAVKVTDAMGCSSIDTVNVFVTNPVLLASVTNASCGNGNGIIDLTVNGTNGANSFNWSNGATTEDINNLQTGTYTVTITNSSCVKTSSFTVQAVGGNAPAAPDGITGTLIACRNQSGVAYSITPVTGALSYNWTFPAEVTGTSNTTSALVNYGALFLGGNICVTSSNLCGTSALKCITITRLTASPPVPTVINGPAIVCSNTVQTFTTPLVTNATIYNWTIPSNTVIVSGAGSNTIQLSFNGSWSTGNLFVSAGNCIGNSGTRSISLRKLPLVPTTITGDRFAVCPGSTHPYSVPVTLGATSFVWTYPAGASISGQGSSSVQITLPVPFASGVISVKGQNTCGQSTARSITVRGIPSVPGAISGPLTNNCGAKNAVYSIATSTTGATGYTWGVPAFASIISGQNTASINVSFIGSGTGTFTVNANNACGSSSNRTLTNVTTLPALPAAINGTATVCANQAGIPFNVVSQPGVNYNWSVPAGASVVTGQNTSNVTVNWGSVAGNIAVIASNSCGSAPIRTKGITINCRLTATGEEGASLFPNPAADHVTLKVEEITQHRYKYELIDMLGNQLMIKEVLDEETGIYIGNFARGIYMLRLNNEEGIVKVFRLAIE